MKAIGRLYQYFDTKNIKPTRFEKDFGLSNGYFGVQLKRDADIGSSILELIINNCRDLDIKWLLTGDGSMLIDPEQKKESTLDYSNCPICNEKEKVIVNQAERIDELKETIALLRAQVNAPAAEDITKRKTA